MGIADDNIHTLPRCKPQGSCRNGALPRDEYLPDASHGIFGSLVIRGHNKPALFLSQYRTIPLDNDVC